MGLILCGGPSLLAGSPQVLVGSVRRRVEGQLHATVVPEPRDAMDSTSSCGVAGPVVEPLIAAVRLVIRPKGMLFMELKLLLLIVALKLVPADIDTLRLQFNDNPAVAIKRDANEQWHVPHGWGLPREAEGETLIVVNETEVAAKDHDKWEKVSLKDLGMDPRVDMSALKELKLGDDLSVAIGRTDQGVRLECLLQGRPQVLDVKWSAVK